MKTALKDKMIQLLHSFLVSQAKLQVLSVDEKQFPVIKYLQSIDPLIELLYQEVAAEVSSDFYSHCYNLKDMSSLKLQLDQLMYKYGKLTDAPGYEDAIEKHNKKVFTDEEINRLLKPSNEATE